MDRVDMMAGIGWRERMDKMDWMNRMVRMGKMDRINRMGEARWMGSVAGWRGWTRFIGWTRAADQVEEQIIMACYSTLR